MNNINTISKKGEILAPVGNKEMLIAAVRSGADAVYLGASNFNARRNADNFSIQELKEAVEYCHIRGVAVYLTLNILVFDDELDSALKLAFDAYNVGIDGVIIADLGLAKLLREKLPDLKLHASTQMTVSSKSALYPLKELGFTRVVAAREMSKNELCELIKEAKRLDMEVEVFVHGALCMCLSGQCLLSAMLGGRSGNRGLCAGTCRLPFSAENGTGYDLSLKDLSLIPYLNELNSLGVASFKIEGRMKRPEYVAAAVHCARQTLDAGKVDNIAYEQLKNIFSRSGFTDGYYTSKTGKDMFGTRTKEDVSLSSEAIPLIHELYRRERQSIPIDATVVIKKGEPALLTFNDGQNCVTVSGQEPDIAFKTPLTKESVFASVGKLGSTAYYINSFTAHIQSGVALKGSVLNAMRRDAAELLDKKRSHCKNNASYTPFVPQSSALKGTDKIAVRVTDPSVLPDDLNGISAVIIPIESVFDKQLLPKNIPLIAEMPRAVVSEEFILKRLNHFKSIGFSLAAIGNLSQIKLVKEAAMPFVAGFGTNITNSQSIGFYKQNGAKAVVLSPELTISRIKSLSCDVSAFIFGYGKLPLMTFRNCPVKNGKNCEQCNKNSFLTDRLGVQFGINCRGFYSEMFNSLPIMLSDKKDDFACSNFLLYFTDETKQEIKEIISAYKTGKKLNIPYTRGLYYRGVE